MSREGTLIAFRLARYERDKASELVKHLYGQRTSSHGGKCVCQRKGLLDEIPHVRLIRGLGAEVKMRTGTLTKADRLALGVRPRSSRNDHVKVEFPVRAG